MNTFHRATHSNARPAARAPAVPATPATFEGKSVAAHALLWIATLLLAACAGGPFGSAGGGTTDGSLYFETVEGTVDSVDTRIRTVRVLTDRDSPVAPGRDVNLRYDDGTHVSYRGRDYRPQDLERGDRIVADVIENRSDFTAQNIVVTTDVSPDDGVGGEPDQEIAGTIRHIDTRSNTLTLDTYGSGPDEVVLYDARTLAYLDNRSIRTDDLRENDRVEIELVPGSRYPLAQTITVTADAWRDGVGYDTGTVRGAVVAVDDRRRELIISTHDRLASGFDVNAGQQGTVAFSFEPEVIVEFRGKYYSAASLERGDEVEVTYERMNDGLWAERIHVTSSIRG